MEEETEKVISAVAIMMKALANETRLKILYRLHEGPKTWTELVSELNQNPKSLRDHLAYLRKYGLVKKRKPVGFALTDASKEFLESNLPQMISVVTRALEIAST